MSAKPLELAASEAEYNTILEVLKSTNFNKSKTAQLLNIDRKTLYNKLSKYKKIKAKEMVSKDS